MRAPILWTLTLAWTAALLTPLAHASTQSPDPFALLGFVENRGQAPQEIFAYTRAGVSLVTRDGRLIHPARRRKRQDDPHRGTLRG